jgi:hypothetical protein
MGITSMKRNGTLTGPTKTDSVTSIAALILAEAPLVHAALVARDADIFSSTVEFIEGMTSLNTNYGASIPTTVLGWLQGLDAFVQASGTTAQQNALAAAKVDFGVNFLGTANNFLTLLMSISSTTDSLSTLSTSWEAFAATYPSTNMTPSALSGFLAAETELSNVAIWLDDLLAGNGIEIAVVP